MAKKKEKFVAYDETQAMADIIKQLSKFWALQDQLNAYLREEEEKAKVYDPTISNAQMMESAMNRVMCRQQMEELSTTIREIMVYQTPGLADLYSQTYEMRQVISEEQEKARLKQEAKKAGSSMATTAGAKKRPAKAGSSGGDFYIPPVPLAVASPRESLGESIMGWIAACVLVALLLPLGAMLYLDILEVKHQVKQEVEKVERLRRQLEQEKRKNDKT